MAKQYATTKGGIAPVFCDHRGGTVRFDDESDNAFLNYDHIQGTWKGISPSQASSIIGATSAGSLAGLSDVHLAGATNNQLLTFNSTTNKWNNENAPTANTALAGLTTDVQITTPITLNQVITWNGTKWINLAPGASTTLAGLTGDVAITSPQHYQVLTYDGTSKWINLPPQGVLAGDTTDLFVSTKGDDTNGNGSINQPFRSIGKAVTILDSTAGGIIEVGSGNFAEDVTMGQTNATIGVSLRGISTPGISNTTIRSLTLRGAQTSVSTLNLNGGSSVVPFTFLSFKNGTSSEHLTLEDCIFSGASSTVNAAEMDWGLTTPTGASVTFDNCDFTLHPGLVNLSDAPLLWTLTQNVQVFFRNCQGLKISMGRGMSVDIFKCDNVQVAIRSTADGTLIVRSCKNANLSGSSPAGTCQITIRDCVGLATSNNANVGDRDVGEIQVVTPLDGQIIGYSALTSKWKNLKPTLSGPAWLGSGVVGLNDVTIASPTNGQVLTYQTGSNHWVNANAPSGGTTALAALTTDVAISAPVDLNVLSFSSGPAKWINAPLPTIPTNVAQLTGDVTISSPTANQILQYNSGAWHNINPPFVSVSGTPGNNTTLLYTGGAWTTTNYKLSSLTDVIGPLTGAQVPVYDSSSTNWLASPYITTLAALTGDVSIASPARGQALVFNGAAWTNFANTPFYALATITQAGWPGTGFVLGSGVAHGPNVALSSTQHIQLTTSLGARFRVRVVLRTGCPGGTGSFGVDVNFAPQGSSPTPIQYSKSVGNYAFTNGVLVADHFEGTFYLGINGFVYISPVFIGTPPGGSHLAPFANCESIIEIMQLPFSGSYFY